MGDSAVKLKMGLMQALNNQSMVSDEQFDGCIKNFLVSKVKFSTGVAPQGLQTREPFFRIRASQLRQKFVAKPILKLTSAKQTLLFNFEDMTEMFQKFGRILRLEVLDDRDVVLAFFEKFKDAFNALKFLHLRKLVIDNQVDFLKCNFLKETELHLIPGPEILEFEIDFNTDTEADLERPDQENFKRKETEPVYLSLDQKLKGAQFDPTNFQESYKFNQHTQNGYLGSNPMQIQSQNGAKIITNIPNLDLAKSQLDLSITLQTPPKNILNISSQNQGLGLAQNSQNFMSDLELYPLQQSQGQISYHQSSMIDPIACSGILQNMSDLSNMGHQSNLDINHSEQKNYLQNIQQSNLTMNGPSINQQRYTNIISKSNYFKRIKLDPNDVCKVNSSANKFTCKYEIHFGSQSSANAFQLAKRIIGPKGSNMKCIIDATFDGRKMIPDYLKLRLRGRGSGFKEGPSKKECDEPLHLCVSARDMAMYNKASGMAQTLLFDVFTQFYRFLKKKDGADMIMPLIIKRESHVAEELNNTVMFPFSEIEQDYDQFVEQETNNRERENTLNRAPKNWKSSKKSTTSNSNTSYHQTQERNKNSPGNPNVRIPLNSDTRERTDQNDHGFRKTKKNQGYMPYKMHQGRISEVNSRSKQLNRQNLQDYGAFGLILQT